MTDRLINNNNLAHTAQTTQLLKSLDLPEHFRSQQSRERPTNIFLDKTNIFPTKQKQNNRSFQLLIDLLRQSKHTIYQLIR